MMSGAILRHSLQVLRAAPSDPAEMDDWGRPIYDPDTVIATVPGLIEPLAMKEVSDLMDAGIVVGDYKAYVLPADVIPSDRIRRVDTDETFEIRGIDDWSGYGYGAHLKLFLHRAVIAVPA